MRLAHLRAIEEAEDIVQAPGNVRGVLRDVAKLPEMAKKPR
jgi:hypothetical protein